MSGNSPAQPSRLQTNFTRNPIQPLPSQSVSLNRPVQPHNLQSNFINNPIQPYASQRGSINSFTQPRFKSPTSSTRLIPGYPYQTATHQPLKFTSQPFVYLKLLYSDSIRLMRIEPGTTETLTLCIENTRLGQISQPYNALSYVWGEHPKFVQVFTSDGSLQVRKNLYDALYRLRLPYEHRYVWADAICINQNDIQEREHQVSLMRAIFQNAISVVIWLGKEDMEEAPIAFSIAHGLVCNGACDGGHQTAGGAGSASQVYCPPPPVDSPLWQTIARLFNNPWFWRVWCIQEVALAASATVLWGHSEIPWKWLGLAAARVRINYHSLLSRDEMKGVFNAYFMYRISQGDVTVKPHMLSFLNLLAMTRQFGTTDPRDRIYGLLGMKTTDSDPENGELYIQPDYSLSTDDVYRELAYRVLETDKSLRLLSCVHHRQEVAENWPSWIPRWGTVYNTSLMPFYDSTSSTPTRSEYKLISRDILQVNGVQVSSVREVLPQFPPHGKKLLPCLEEHQHVKLTRFLETPEGPIRFCLTLTAGQTWHGDYATDHDEHLNDFAEVIRKDEPELSSYFKDRVGGNYRHLGKSTRNTCVGRRLFFDTDDQLGLAPEAAEPGDWICILSEERAPFVIRPKDRYFLLVGECYLHEYMKGQMGTLLQEGRSTKQTFEFH